MSAPKNVKSKALERKLDTSQAINRRLFAKLISLKKQHRAFDDFVVAIFTRWSEMGIENRNLFEAIWPKKEKKP